MVCVWLQNIDGLMMARQYDSKHNDYRMIPVHATSNRRMAGGGKPYANLSAECAPRYEPEYEYKTTHYPSYPANYPYDEAAKFKAYDGQQYAYDAKSQPSAYAGTAAGYEAPPAYDARATYAAPAQPYCDTDYSRYPAYDERATYTDQVDYDKTKYAYSYETDERYAQQQPPLDNRYERDGYVADDRRYDREADNRYPTEDARYADSSRYSSKENYYDRYYKHRPSRDHHVADPSRY